MDHPMERSVHQGLRLFLYCCPAVNAASDVGMHLLRSCKPRAIWDTRAKCSVGRADTRTLSGIPADGCGLYDGCSRSLRYRAMPISMPKGRGRTDRSSNRSVVMLRSVEQCGRRDSAADRLAGGTGHDAVDGMAPTQATRRRGDR